MKNDLPKNINCESCGKDFRCDAKSGDCWCFRIELTPETLAKLRGAFRGCLCRDCLPKAAVKPEKPN